MNIPDYISPLVAYRVWQWDAVGLKSLNNEQWLPGEALKANCRAMVVSGHGAPGDCCSCGVYAANNFDHLKQIGYLAYGVHGEVYLWGTVVEHKLGWRTQFAYPKTLVLPPSTIPFKMSEVETRLESLMTYGADIAIASSVPIPLWSKRSGFDPVGLDWLVEKRKRWYSYREEDRRLKAGDRVAVLGKGIGVVEHVDGNGVHVLMWNLVTLKFPRKQVVWSRQNWRWESDATGSFARSGAIRVPAISATVTTL